ncbi:helix-turn-helix transcriptional regulator [Dactylosporangium sp. CA-092794]|uniref:helix-turn-helix transcriptional regulator n=1 Tax=Dactylosporangium sp. CA-092794 TaxID=3239929 RepID=UPI003D901BCB
MSQDRSAFGAFLRARRDRLTPAQAGIDAFPGARRVPGLRREELAMLAGLSTDHYSRLEQGRQSAVSESVLTALTRALRLNDVEAAHLRDLAAPTSRQRAPAPEVQRPDPGLLRLAVALDHVPVLLLGQRSEVLARNALLQAVLGRPLPPGSSFMDFLFRDPLARERIVNWAEFGARSIAAMRLEVGRRPHDRQLADEVRDLLDSDPDAARWWQDHAVRDYASVSKRIVHPEAGVLDFGIEIVTAPHLAGQHLVVYTVEPGSPTARILPILASWATDVTRDPASSARSGRVDALGSQHVQES